MNFFVYFLKMSVFWYIIHIIKTELFPNHIPILPELQFRKFRPDLIIPEFKTLLLWDVELVFQDFWIHLTKASQKNYFIAMICVYISFESTGFCFELEASPYISDLICVWTSYW